MRRRILQTVPAAATAIAILAQAALVRLFLAADEARVYLLGRPIEIECAFRARFGLPCPGCGLTRSVVMAVHGQLGRAWNVAPGGAAGVVGALVFAAGLLVLAGLTAAGDIRAYRFRRHFLRFALAGAAVVFTVWTAGWASSLAAAFHRHF
jgi:hypothetical protein